MDSIISPIVESVKKHLGFLVFSNEYVEDMKKKMDNLNHIEKDIQESGSESHRKRKWLEDVKNLNERSNLIEAPRFFNLAKRYKLGKQSYGILEEIEDLENRESKIEFTHAQKCLAEIASTSTGPSTSTPDGTQNNFKSRELIYNAALKFLQPNNESHKMIALCGMGGVGKTTMMEELLKEVQASNVFDRVVKVVIGESTSLIALQRAIAIYINKEDLKEETQDARADRLRTIFEGMANQGKKTLVIMDDIWSEVDLKDVGLSHLPNGFKLLITSRFDYVCTKMGVEIDSVHKIPVLNEAEAKALFFGIVGPSTLDGDDPELYKIGEAIVNKCRGLPIALKTIAKSLIGNIKEAWKETLSNLQHADLQDLDDIVHRIFEMSYNNLKREDDKSIFLLSGLFPDDFDIPIEDLVRYGWGLKLFTNVDTLRDARTRTITCVNNLMQANLLIESGCMGCVKMHDLVRAFALSNFTKVKQASIAYHDNMSGQRLIKDAKESYDRILLKCTGNSKFPVDLNYQNLSLLIVLMDYHLLKFPQNIYEKTEKLEVSSYQKMRIPLLPTMFEHSTKLRTLCLRSCPLIDDISFLGSLSHLEVLSIVNCGIRRLPSMIGRLKKLKLLDLTGCVDLCIDDGVFKNLDNLEELYMRAAWYNPIRFTDANCEELEILSQQLFALELEFCENNSQPKKVSFEKLERFRISIGCRLVELEDDKKYSFKNTIKFVGECNELLECRISELFEKTEELHLQVNDMNHLENIVSTHHSFSSMTEVFECESINNVDEGGAPLRNVTVVVVPQLSNLKSLSISECDRLPHIFTFSTFGTLHHLKELKVKRCVSMQVIVKQENGTSSDCVALPRLETLELEHLPNLKGFFLGMNDFRWSSLAYVLIKDCPELMMFTSGQSTTPKLKFIQTSFGKYSQTTFPALDPTISKGMPFSFHNLIEININKKDVGRTIIPSHALLQLQKLQQIHLSYCKRVEEVFEVVASEGTNGSGFNESQTAVQIPNLTQVKLYWLEDLKYLWKSNKWMVLEFPNLTTLSIYRCNSLEHVFTCSMVGSLVQLQDLSIINCRNIEVIVKQEEEKECDAKVSEIMLPRLNFLTLSKLPKLKGFYLGKEAFSLPLLETLQIESCSALTVFTNGHVSIPELKVIYTGFRFSYVNTDINSFIKTKQEEKLWYSDEDERQMIYYIIRNTQQNTHKFTKISNLKRN